VATEWDELTGEETRLREIVARLDEGMVLARRDDESPKETRC